MSISFVCQGSAAVPPIDTLLRSSLCLTVCNKSIKMASKHGRKKKKAIEGEIEKRIGIGIAVIAASWEVIHLQLMANFNSVLDQINDNFFEFVFTLKFRDRLKGGP